MAISWGVTGLKEVEDTLKRLGSADTRRRANLAGARVLVSMATQAFRVPSMRPAPWPPLAASTLGRAGSSSTGAREARKKAAEFAAKAAQIAAGGARLTGRKLETALRKSEAAAKKAREWKGRAKTAAAKAAGSRQPLYDTGALSQSLTLKIGSAKAGVASDRPYAAYHQYGSKDGKHPPARPFVPVLGPPGGEKLTDNAAQFVKGAVEAELRKIAAGR